jgi:hypothetical protein
MKIFIICLLVCFASLATYAQTNPDSLAYQLQRKKINSMLDTRREKFGQYDESLSQHTGIFGLQTKKDIRRSNEILMEIVKTDDSVFKELKILLDYRAFEQSQVQTHSKDIEDSNLGFMTTINKLRNELDRVKKEADDERKRQETVKMVLIFIVGLTILVSILYIIRKKRTLKA